jgi:hypothetical protein
MWKYFIRHMFIILMTPFFKNTQICNEYINVSNPSPFLGVGGTQLSKGQRSHLRKALNYQTMALL